MCQRTMLIWAISFQLGLVTEASHSHDDIQWKRVNSSKCEATERYPKDQAEKPIFRPSSKQNSKLTLDQCKKACLKEKDVWKRPCKAIEVKGDNYCNLAWGCETVRPSSAYDVLVQKNTTCRDDPYGIVAAAPLKDCSELERTGKWSCTAFDADFNGHSVQVWELCPKSCKHCAIAGLKCDEKTERCDDQKDKQNEGDAKLPRRPPPECRIKEDCRWCGHGWDVTEYCKDGICFNREPDERCEGKKNGWKLKDGSFCWSEQRQERCQEPLENGYCFNARDCKRDYYCRKPNLLGKSRENVVPVEDQAGGKPNQPEKKPGSDVAPHKPEKPFRPEAKPDQPTKKPGSDVAPQKPEKRPAAGPSPPKTGQEDVHPPRSAGKPSIPHVPADGGGHEIVHQPPTEGKPGVPHVPADGSTQEIYPTVSGGVCVPCYEVDCNAYDDKSEAQICCPIIEPLPPPNSGLRILVIGLTILAIFVCISFVSLMVFFLIRYRRMKREIQNMHLYNEQVVHRYQGPILPPAPAREYQPGAVVVRVQATHQDNLVR